MKWQSVYLLTDIVLLLVATSFEAVPADVAMFTALLAIWVPGVLETKQAIAGFSNPGLTTVVALFVVIGGVQKLPLLKKAANLAFGNPKNGRIALLKQILVVAFFSVFINNTALVAFFIPIIVDWCRTYRQNPSQYLMALSYAAIMGDLSVIGTSTSLVVQGLVTARGLPPISFFDLAYVGAPALVCGTLYLTTYGYSVLSKINAKPEGIEKGGEGNASATDYVAELVLDKGSNLVGRPVLLSIAHIMAGEGSVLRILRDPLPRNAGHANTGDPESPPEIVNDVTQLELGPSVGSVNVAIIPNRFSRSRAHSQAREHVHELIDFSGQGFTVVAPVTEKEVFAEGDRLIVRASETGLLKSYAEQVSNQLKFSAGTPHHGSRDARRYKAFKSLVTAAHTSLFGRFSWRVGENNDASVPVPASRSMPDLTANDPAPAPAPTTMRAPLLNGYEVFLSNSCPVLGHPVCSGILESTYGVSVLGVRLGNGNAHVRTFGRGAVVHSCGVPTRGKGGDTALEVTPIAGLGPGKTEDEGEGGILLDRPATDPSMQTIAPALDLGSLTYAAGDSILVTAQKEFGLDYAPGKCKDFFVVSKVAGASDIEPTGHTQYGSLLLLVAMFIIGSIGSIGGIPFEMEKAACVAAGLNILLGFVSPREAYKLIHWDLVILIGSSFGLGAAMESTGLARDIAGGIVSASASGGAHAALFLMYGVTLFLTELISNNAAATLTIPVAINMAKQLGVNYQPFVLSICIACTAAFALPLGYQTHLMVMAPGGYTQRDFLRVGLGMDAIYWAVIAGLAPFVWKF